MLEWRCLTTVQCTIEMRLQMTVIEGKKGQPIKDIYAPKDKQIKGANAFENERSIYTYQSADDDVELCARKKEMNPFSC